MENDSSTSSFKAASAGSKSKNRNNKKHRQSLNEKSPAIPQNDQTVVTAAKSSAPTTDMSSCSPVAAGLEVPDALSMSNGHAEVSNTNDNFQNSSTRRTNHTSASKSQGEKITTADRGVTAFPDVSSIDASLTSVHNIELDSKSPSALNLSRGKSDKKNHSLDVPRATRAPVENMELENKPIPVSAVAVTDASGDQKPRSQQTKAERRAVQEAQRAAKAAGKPPPHQAKSNAPVEANQQPAESRRSAAASATATESESKQQPAAPKNSQKPVIVSKTPATVTLNTAITAVRQPQGIAAAESGGTFEIFSHLQKYQGSLPYDERFIRPPKYPVHPAFVRLGALNAKRVVDGSNARCVALLYAFKQVIRDYVTPPDKDLSRDLEAKIKPYINFLTQCRPMSVSMGNAVRHVKHLITNSPGNVTEQVAKEKLLDEMDFFINEKILLAGEAISKTYAFEKINAGDNILTYAWSDLVTKVLCDAHRMGRRFSVTVVDSRPRTEGRETIRRLVENGIPCSYVSIAAVSYVMPEVSKVLLGAESLLANGYVMSHVGTSQLCLVAKAFNKPVLVCCETYKFCERVQTDSIVNNELGNPYDVSVTSLNLNKFSVSGAAAIQAEDAAAAATVARSADTVMQPTPYLSRLNLLFDVTPPDLITVVITEVGMVPCTSVPVVLRVKHALN